MKPHLRVRKVLQARYLACAHAVALSLVLTGAAHADAPRVTVIADSVGGALLWEPGAHAIVSNGFDVDVEAIVCRKLATPGCGTAVPPPESALSSAESLPNLGKIVVIATGYNDTTPEVTDAIDPIMRTLVARGVEHVIWVDYVEHLSEWADSNAVLVAAAARWPQLQVADWNAVALSHDEWFNDLAHLDSLGAQALARFLHPFLVSACGAGCVPPPVFCGLARTVNGFDYVQATGITCPSALGVTVSIERGVRGAWACARNTGGVIELTCANGDQKIELLERSPVAAQRSGDEVRLANWTFRLHTGRIEGRSSKRWLPLGGPPWCIPDVPREVLLAFRLRSITKDGGCFVPL